MATKQNEPNLFGSLPAGAVIASSGFVGSREGGQQVVFLVKPVGLVGVDVPMSVRGAPGDDAAPLVMGWTKAIRQEALSNV